MRGFLLGLALLSVGIVVGSAVALVIAAPKGMAGTPSGRIAGIQPMNTVALGSSHLLGGYAVVAAKNATVISGDWNIPKVHGTCPSKLEATFVGISLGGYSTGTVAFAGVYVACQSGKPVYFSFYQLSTSAYAGTLAVAAGDHMHAVITHASLASTVSISLKDVTKGTSTSRAALMTVASPVDALWVDEAVVSTSTGAILPLVNFGNVTFTGCTATLNGTTSHTLGFYGNTAIEMYNKANTAFKADVSTITSTNKGFTVFWKSAGP